MIIHVTYSNWSMEKNDSKKIKKYNIKYVNIYYVIPKDMI